MRLQPIWMPVLFHGAALVLLGAMAIAAPRWASLTVDVIIGISFSVSAAAGLWTYMSVRDLPGTVWILFWALLSGVIGAIMMMKPEAALLSLTMLVIVYLFSHGLVSILAALEYRDLLPGVWGWGIAEGLCHIALAGLLAIGLPDSSMWTIGTLAGVSLIIFGTNLIAIAATARRFIEI